MLVFFSFISWGAFSFPRNLDKTCRRIGDFGDMELKLIFYCMWSGMVMKNLWFWKGCGKKMEFGTGRERKGLMGLEGDCRYMYVSLALTWSSML